MSKVSIRAVLLVVALAAAGCAPSTVDDPGSAIVTVDEIHGDVLTILSETLGAPDNVAPPVWYQVNSGCYTIDPTDTVRWGRREVWARPHDIGSIETAMGQVETYFRNRGELYDLGSGVEFSDGKVRLSVRAGDPASDAVYWFDSRGWVDHAFFSVETGCLEAGTFDPPDQ